jgi:hypothetical protein
MISLSVDLGDILDLNSELRPKIEKALKEAAASLSRQAHAHILEEVQNGEKALHSTQKIYTKALGFKQVNEHTWVITLDQKAMWIEEGRTKGEMISDLLKSTKTKTAADGSRFLSVPFKHNKGPTSSTPAQQDLTATVRKEMAKRKIPYGNLEMDAGGKPKLGLLHSFDITKGPLKTSEGPNSRGQGQGPMGAVRQGHTGIPYLQGVRIYQKEVKDEETGRVSFKKDIMTFRMVSSKMMGSGKWVYPDVPAKKFFEECEQWVLKEWPRIRDQILAQVANDL